MLAWVKEHTVCGEFAKKIVAGAARLHANGAFS
jgi:hypothetical protein